MSIQASQLKQRVIVGGILDQQLWAEQVTSIQGKRPCAFVLDFWGFLLYGNTQAQGFLTPTSVADIPLAYEKILVE